MDNLKGIAWMTLAMFGFACCDTFIKLASEGLPVGQILATFGAGGALVFGIWSRLQGHDPFGRAFFSGPVMMRNGFEIAATLMFVTALSRVDLAIATVMIQAVPLVVTLGSAVLLGAPVGWRRWTAIGIGLFGVILIVRPGSVVFDPWTLLLLGGVLCLSGRDLVTRLAPPSVPTPLLACWAFAALVPAALILLMIQGGAAIPSAREAAQLAGAVVTGCLAYLSIISAMRIGEIAVVTPFRYTRLIFGLGLAIVIFRERPDSLTWLGAAIILVTGLFTLWRETQAARRPFAPPPAGG